MTEKNLEKSILDEIIQKAQIRAQKDLQSGYPKHKEKSKEEEYWEVYWDAYDESMGNKDRELVCPMCGARGNAIKMIQDKSKEVDEVRGIPIYGRKFVCTKCGYEF